MKDVVGKVFVRRAITKPGARRLNCYDDGIHKKLDGLHW